MARLVSSIRFAVVAAVVAMALFSAAGAQERATPPGHIQEQHLRPLAIDPRTQIPPERLPGSIRDGFTLAVAGYLNGSSFEVVPLDDPEFNRVTKLLNDATLAFASHHNNILDLATTQAYPAGRSTNPVQLPEVAADYAKMGFDILGRAGNHAGDWGVEGHRETARHLNDAGIRTVGYGENKSLANEAVYMATPYGRVAFIAAAAHRAAFFHPAAPATDPVGAVRARPGISAVRTYEDGSLNPNDHFDILKAIRTAKQRANFVVFSLNWGDREPSLTQLFHDAVDAGADLVVGHGEHVIHGIEVYNGTPIFYSVGNFMINSMMGQSANWNSYEAIDKDPRTITYQEYAGRRFGTAPASWFDNFMITAQTRGGKISRVAIHPLDNGRGRDNFSRGHPHLASGEAARRVFDTLAEKSREYGTVLRVQGDTAYLDLE